MLNDEDSSGDTAHRNLASFSPTLSYITWSPLTVAQNSDVTVTLFAYDDSANAYLQGDLDLYVVVNNECTQVGTDCQTIQGAKTVLSQKKSGKMTDN